MATENHFVGQIKFSSGGFEFSIKTEKFLRFWSSTKTSKVKDVSPLVSAHEQLLFLEKSQWVFILCGDVTGAPELEFFGVTRNNFDKFCEKLILAIECDSLIDFLRDLDGSFCIQIFDKCNDQFYFITDRLGLQKVFFHKTNSSIFWSTSLGDLVSSLSAFPTICMRSVRSFINVGYCLDKFTIFEDIELLRPALLLKYSMADGSCQERRYWTWSDVGVSYTDFHVAVDAGIEALELAIRRSIGSSERVGFGLSGGLDSRFIAAETVSQVGTDRCLAYTFGNSRAFDVEIAKRVACELGVRHKITDFSSFSQEDLSNRMQWIWASDGELDVMHMHGVQVMSDNRSNADINVNGYLGDVIFGGSYLVDHVSSEHILGSSKKSELIVNHDLKNLGYDIGEIDFDYYQSEHHDVFQIMNRGRRFINSGTIAINSLLPQKLPFVSNFAIDFMCRIPDVFRKNNEIYSSILLSRYPNLFKEIPWEKTGLKLSDRQTYLRRAMVKFKKFISRNKYNLYYIYGGAEFESIASKELSVNLSKFRRNEDYFYVNASVERFVRKLESYSNSNLEIQTRSLTLARFISLCIQKWRMENG